MGQVLTNNTGLSYIRRPVVSNTWKQLEPDSIRAFGADVQTVSRNPISKLRQLRKGTVVGVDAAAEYEADLTIDSLLDFTEGFLYANATNQDLTFLAADAVGGGTPGYTIPAATAAQAAKIQYTAAGPISLVWAKGYVTTANNSSSAPEPITADVAAAGTTLPVASRTAETAPTNAEVSIAGIRAEAGDLALSVSSNIGTLTSNNGTPVTPIDFTTLGLTAGQRIHIGGAADANRFGSTAAADGTRSYGSARIRTIAAQTLTLDKLDATLVASDGTDDGNAGTEIPTDLLFGRFVRNVTVDDSSYEAIEYDFEGSLPNLFETEPATPVANPDGFQYVRRAQANQWTWQLPVRGKASATFAFIARDADEPVDNASRDAGASTARLPLFTGALNTSADLFRLGVFDVDDTGLASDFKDLTVTINNNANPELVLGVEGARYINTGNFTVNVAGEALFNNYLVAQRIRSNTGVTMDWLMRNDDGAIAVDIPSAIIKGNGGQVFEANVTVRIGLDIEAYVDDLFQTSIGVSFFPYYPPAA